MIRLPKAERVVVPGPAGGLEALLEVPEVQIEKIAVLCHPHPLYHGTMNNKVVHTLARTFQRLGVACLRFNFRGVGGSGGSYDDGQGETRDALAATEFMRDRFPKAKLWLAGFSFGGAVALRAARLVSADLLVTVAPALQKMKSSTANDPRMPVAAYPWRPRHHGQLPGEPRMGEQSGSSARALHCPRSRSFFSWQTEPPSRCRNRETGKNGRSPMRVKLHGRRS